MKLWLTIPYALLIVYAGAGEAEVVSARIDSRSNLVIGRKPVFPLELYSVRTEEDFAIARAQGFNAVIEFGENLEARAHRHGMLLTDPQWYGRDTADSKVRADVARRRGQPALFAYNLNDEPDLRPESGVAPSDLGRITRLLRQLDPKRLLSVTCSGGAGGTTLWRDYAALVDIFRIDPYPVVSGAPLSLVPERVRLAREAAGSGKPVWVVLQAWTLGPGSALPTAREDRCMTYLAVASGAKGLSHFDFNVEVWSQHPGLWNGLLLNNRELRLLSPVLLEGEPVAIECSSPAVRAAAWRWERSVVMILVNETAKAVQADVRVTGARGKTLRTVLLFKERLSLEELAPLEFARVSDDAASGQVSLGPLGVQVVQLLPSRSARALDPDPLFETPVIEERVRIIEREGKHWLRLKNMADTRSTVSLHWPKGSPEIYELDLAFRPMRRVTYTRSGGRPVFAARPQTAYEVGKRPGKLDLLNAAASFRRLDLDLELSSQYPVGGFGVPGQRFRAFVGAKLPIAVTWSSRRPLRAEEVNVEILKASWEPQRLTPFPSVQPRTKRGCVSFLIEAQKPVRWDRDEELTLRISRGRRHVVRRMRFRMERPFEPEFNWEATPDGLTSGTGTVQLRPRFPGYRFEDLQVRPADPPPGWRVTVEPGAEARQYEVTAVPPQDLTLEGTVHRLHLQFGAAGLPNERFELPRLLLWDSSLHVATPSPRRVQVRGAASPIIIDGKLGREEWSSASPLVGFLEVGAAHFAGSQPRAWVCRTPDALYLAAELPVHGGIRARVAKCDEVDATDDLLELYLDSSQAPGFYGLYVNAHGNISDFTCTPSTKLGPELDLKWDSGATAATQRLDKIWALELCVPLGRFPGGPPKPGTKWRFNIRTPHGIAPRSAEVYSFSGTWRPWPNEFAFLEF